MRPGGAYVERDAEGYASGSDNGATPGHFFEVFLTPEAVLVGKVVRVADGTPDRGRAGHRGVGRWGWNQATAFTDGGGNFRLDGLQPGPYKARAESDDAIGLADEQAILGLGETSEPIVIKAHPAYFIEGTVVIEGGDVCDDGWVSVVDKVNDRNSYGVAGAGRHDADPRGAAGRVRGQRPLRGLRVGGEVPAGDDRRQERGGAQVAGDARAGDPRGGGRRAGKPARKVSVSANPKPDPKKPRAHQTQTWGTDTDDQGRFEIAGHAAGRVHARPRRRG